VAATLQSAGTRLTDGLHRRFGRRWIVAAEVALSVVLLVGAGLLAGSFARLQRVTPGFDSRGVMAAYVLLPVGEQFDFGRDGPGWARFFDEFTARLDALPGVRDAGAVSSLPLSGAVESGGFTIEGRPTPSPGDAPTAEYAVISGDYFGAMGIRVLGGRTFDSRDRSDAPGVVIVSSMLVNPPAASAFAQSTSPSGESARMSAMTFSALNFARMASFFMGTGVWEPPG
jgi:hypothetical protein